MKRFVDYFDVNTRAIHMMIRNRYKETHVITGFIAFAIVIVVIYVLGQWMMSSMSIEHYSSDFPFLTQPHIDNNDKIYIRTADGKYLSSCVCSTIDDNLNNNCSRTLCLKDEPLLNSQFVFHKHSDGTFSLETYDGKYWKRCAECINGCPNVICADGINPNLQTHKFVLIKNGKTQTNDPTAIDNTISIKTDNGRLLEVTDCNQSCGKIITALGLNSSSSFIVERIATPEAIKTLKRINRSQKLEGQYDQQLPQSFPKQWPFTES